MEEKSQEKGGQIEVKTTIHYISDFIYLKGANAVKKHIRYIYKNADAIMYDDGYKFSKAIDELKAKRKDARLLLKFTLAIPNSMWSTKAFMITLKKFLSSFFNVEPYKILLVLHKQGKIGQEIGTKNKHIHVCIVPQHTNGKKFRLNRVDLRAFHQAYDLLLQRLGYKIRKDPPELKAKHLGYRLHKDKQLLMQYILYLHKKQKLLTQQQTSLSPQRTCPVQDAGETTPKGKVLRPPIWRRL